MVTWSSQSPCDKLLYLLKPQFLFCTKKRLDQGMYLAVLSLGAFTTSSHYFFVVGHLQSSRICFAWVYEVRSTWEFTHHSLRRQLLTKDWKVGAEKTPAFSPPLRATLKCYHMVSEHPCGDEPKSPSEELCLILDTLLPFISSATSHSTFCSTNLVQFR